MVTMLNFPTNRKFDLACLGRLAVDLYAQQLGCALEDVSSFAKYLGGSSANIAFGAARLGIRSAMISRVGDEQMGRFLLQQLRQENCDVSQVQIDPQRLTGLVLLGLKDQNTFPLLFYRENCADMALDANAIDESFIQQCRALLVTGTHLSTPTVLNASKQALVFAKKHDVIRVLDIDYRPVLWGLTKRGDGENRFVDNAKVTHDLQQQLDCFELIIGTEEEFQIAGGHANDCVASLRAVRTCTNAVLVLKRGALGCSIFPDQIPDVLDDALTILGEKIEVLNVLGAGDAFAAGLLSSLLQGKSWQESAEVANACGAIVVSRHACAPAMPTPDELMHWFSGNRHVKPDQDRHLAHLHRVSAARPEWPKKSLHKDAALFVLAFDHRIQFFQLAQSLGKTEVDVIAFKKVLFEAVWQLSKQPELAGQIGILADDQYGQYALQHATGQGWWIGRPVERPGSYPLEFDNDLPVATQLIHWPKEHVVKCLVFYHPDDAPSIRAHQEARLLELWRATRISGHELLLEIIPPKSINSCSLEDVVLRSMTRFYNLGLKPEWWKLPLMEADNWRRLNQLIQTRDLWCRGMVVLGLNQTMAQLCEGFSKADAPLIKGFMIGRSIWHDPARAWLSQEITDAQVIEQIKKNFLYLVDSWHNR